jgi:CheY-like chemotaxis protein
VLAVQRAKVAPVGGSTSNNGYRALVVDDEARLRDVLLRILRHESIEAHAAGDARQALSMARTGNYDLIILDLLMPTNTSSMPTPARSQNSRRGSTGCSARRHRRSSFRGRFDRCNRRA